MASLADFLNDTSRNVLRGIIAEENDRVEKERIKKLKETGVRDINEVIQHLKSGGMVWYYGTSLVWDEEAQEKPIVWTRQVSDGNDCAFWDVSENLSIKDFSKKFKADVDVYGYLEGFSKY